MSAGEGAPILRNLGKSKQSLELRKSSTEKKICEENSQEISVPPKNITQGKAEEINLNWIKSLNELEANSNMENEESHSDKGMPEFCSNRI